MGYTHDYMRMLTCIHMRTNHCRPSERQAAAPIVFALLATEPTRHHPRLPLMIDFH